jgi:hypothetical protein
MGLRDSTRAVVAACLLLFGLAAGTALAAGRDTLQQGIQFYERAEFEEAQRLLLESINSGFLEPSSLARAYAYLGLIYLAGDQDSYAEDAFARAKGQDPSFRLDPALFSPAAVSLFERARPKGQPVRPLSAPPPPAAKSTPAPAAPAPASKPADKPVAPTSSPALPDSVFQPGDDSKTYVIDVAREDITIDRGNLQGVRIGDRFEIIEERVIVHPITGNQLHSRRRVAMVMVVDVQSDLSLARIVSGRLDLLKPGLEARPMSEPTSTGGESPSSPDAHN